jgi:hypothetical protein
MMGNALQVLAMVTSVAIRGPRPPVTLETQVGSPFDAAAARRDVRTLWDTGRYSDIRVEVDSDDAVVFRVTPKRAVELHEIRIEPNSFGLQLNVPQGKPIDAVAVQRIVVDAQQQLRRQGYRDPQIAYRFVPAPRHQFDLKLTVTPGRLMDVKRVEFAGDLGLRARDLRASLRDLKSKPMLPFWRLLPPYSEDAVESDMARLRAVYWLRGYRDAAVELVGVEFAGKHGFIRLHAEAGEQTAPAVSARAVCEGLFAERRSAEQRGVLDFSPSLTAPTTLGPAYRVGRIDFFGSRRFGDLTLRRQFLLLEGEPLDELHLRKSVARIDRLGLFDPIDSSSVVVRTHAETGIADITLHVTDRKRSAWSFAGPLPLTASISTRLPAIPAFTVSASLFAFAHPLIPVRIPLLPVLALRGHGLVVAPQLGWKGSAFLFGAGQLERRLVPLLEGNHGLVPPIAVPGSNGAVLSCAPPRLNAFRRAAAIAVRMAGGITGM